MISTRPIKNNLPVFCAFPILLLLIFSLGSCGNNELWSFRIPLREFVLNQNTQKENKGRFKLIYDDFRPNKEIIVHDNFLIVSKDRTYYLHDATRAAYPGVFVLDKDTGSGLWEFPGGSNSFNISDGILYISGDRLYSLDLKTGLVVWQFDPPNPAPVKNRHFGIPFIAGKYVLIGVSGTRNDQNVYCLDKKTGKVVWKRGLASPDFLSYRRSSRTVYLDSNTLHALDVNSGNVKWKASKSSPARTFAVLAQDKIISGSMQASVLVALDMESGKEIWKLSGIGISLTFPPPVIHNNRGFMVNNKTGKLFSFDIEDGRVLWEVEFIKKDHKFPLSLMIVNNNVYCAFRLQKQIIVYSPEDGSMMRKISVNHPVDSPVIYENERIYYIGSGNKVHVEVIKQ